MAEIHEILKRKKNGEGYSVEDVDEFVDYVRHFWNDPENCPTEAQIRGIKFKTVRRGYDFSGVKELLKQFELAISKRNKEAIIQNGGEGAWHEFLKTSLDGLQSFIDRPKKQRFNIVDVNQNGEGYKISQVDKLVDKINMRLRGAKKKPTTDDFRELQMEYTFGKSAYLASDVDWFLDQSITVLNAQEL